MAMPSQPGGQNQAPAVRERGGGDDERGWLGRITAASIGSTLLAFAFGLFVTIYVPGASGLDEAFLGGLSLVVFWPVTILWALFARSGRGAWTRIGIPLLVLLALDAGGLLL